VPVRSLPQAAVTDEPQAGHERDQGRDAKPYRKRAIPLGERRRLAVRYGAAYGSVTAVRCHYCGAPGVISWTLARYWPNFSLDIDHVIPELHGGPSVAENLVLACTKCNRGKGARLLWPAYAVSRRDYARH
jgi:5-methylcytosine-specific restriction endonuclease McrA